MYPNFRLITVLWRHNCMPKESVHRCGRDDNVINCALFSQNRVILQTLSTPHPKGNCSYFYPFFLPSEFHDLQFINFLMSSVRLFNYLLAYEFQYYGHPFTNKICIRGICEIYEQECKSFDWNFYMYLIVTFFKYRGTFNIADREIVDTWKRGYIVNYTVHQRAPI